MSLCDRSWLDGFGGENNTGNFLVTVQNVGGPRRAMGRDNYLASVNIYYWKRPGIQEKKEPEIKKRRTRRTTPDDDEEFRVLSTRARDIQL